MWCKVSTPPQGNGCKDYSQRHCFTLRAKEHLGVVRNAALTEANTFKSGVRGGNHFSWRWLCCCSDSCRNNCNVLETRHKSLFGAGYSAVAWDPVVPECDGQCQSLRKESEDIPASTVLYCYHDCRGATYDYHWFIGHRSRGGKGCRGTFGYSRKSLILSLLLSKELETVRSGLFVRPQLMQQRSQRNTNNEAHLNESLAIKDDEAKATVAGGWCQII